MMSSITRAKKHFLWIFAVLFLACIVIWQRSTPGTYQLAISAKDQVARFLNYSYAHAPQRDHDEVSMCTEEETACRIHEFRGHVNKVCRFDKEVRHDEPDIYLKGYLNHNHQLLYFAIPKVGCSFWKRIFKVLNDKRNQTNMFDIPNYKAHFGAGLNEVKSKERMNQFLPTYTSFLFVRDPFSRLFSGYVDKMYLPNPIAVGHANNIFKRYGSSDKEPCVHNISFTEMALYVANAILARRMSDPHFVPMWFHCNPCDVNLTYIGKMEHFMDDTNFILSKAGVNLNDVAGVEEDDDTFEEKHEKGYMEDIIQRTFKFINNPRSSLCVPRLEVLQRLWTTFYIRGYLSKSQPMPHFPNPKQVTVDQFVNATWKAYDVSGSKLERSQQREEAMMEAYSQVPRRTLEKLAQAFDMDCRVFDYNCNIAHRFPPSKSIRPFYFKR